MQSSEEAKAADEKTHVAKLYGAVQGLREDFCARAKDEGEGEALRPPPAWEARGTVLGLVIDVGAASASKVVLLATLMIGVTEHGGNLTQCRQKDTIGLRGYGDELLCMYTQAFMFTFPALATVVLLLLMGRDLLQKRLYYGLLKAGGVLSFSENVAWRDPLILSLCVYFAHCVWHMAFAFTVLHREDQLYRTSFILSGGMVSSVPAEVASLPLVLGGQKYLEMFMHVLTVFLPIILLIVFFFLAYDIEKSLVPLSEYFGAFEDDDARVMPELHVFKDSVAKQLMDLNGDLHSGPDVELERAYERTVEWYKKKKSHIRPSMLVPMPLLSPRWINLESFGLFQGLWPAELLMSRRFTEASARNFQYLWLGFVAVALGWLVAIEVFMVILSKDEVERFLDGQLEQLVSLSIVLLTMAVVAAAIWAFARTLL